LRALASSLRIETENVKRVGLSGAALNIPKKPAYGNQRKNGLKKIWVK
jgi:hypothetical protein